MSKNNERTEVVFRHSGNCANDVIDWAGCAGLWGGGVTPIELPTFAMYKEPV